MDDRVRQRLNEVARLSQQVARRRSLALFWCIAACAIYLCLNWLDGSSQTSLFRQNTVAVFLSVTAFCSLWLSWPDAISAALRRDVGRRIEEQFSELRQRLVTLLDQVPDPTTGRFSVLQRQLAHEVAAHAETNDWRVCISTRQLRVHGATACIACLTTLFGCWQLWLSHPLSVASVAGQTTNPLTGESTSLLTTLEVEPGDLEIERGSNLLVIAKFAGPLPSNVSLLVSPETTVTAQPIGADALKSSPIAMSKSLDDPLFGTQLPSVEKSFRYSIRYDEHVSRDFNVTVFELPRIDRVDARIEFPSYTNLSPELVEDTWQVSAVEGSTVTLKCAVNKPLKFGRLVAADGTGFDLNAGENGTYVVRIPVTKSQRLKFELKDDRNRTNRDTHDFRIVAQPNRPADIAITFPAKDQKVSPIEELQLQATVFDDFGVKEHGLVVSLADRDPRDITLGKEAAAKSKHAIEHVLALELMQAEPDQLVSYYFFADDIAADGSSRRTMSDMFFAEVRHFEEIFRQGEQPPGGNQQQQQQQQGNQQTQQIGQLADQQKQIINATWKIIRREATTPNTLSAGFVSDVKSLVEAQDKLIEQFEKLAENLSDPQSKRFGEAVRRAMQTASARLHEAQAETSRTPLNPGLVAERGAYEALLKLKAREHKVVQSKSGGGQGSSAASPSQAQLSQLELDQKQNRYEAERQAGEQTQKAAEQREQLQVLNRLRELAQRQGDVNEKLKELERELAAAKAAEEQEELKRQLKRLRDEQRDLLRDVDELKNRMDRPDNQQKFAESRQQLEETRSKVRQTSDALEEGKVAQALSSGKRAEQELNEMRDDMRKKAAGQFGEAMKQLRDQARELNQKQDELAKALTDPEPAPKPNRSLKTTDNRQQLADDFQKQGEKLKQVLDEARQVVERAEASEPALSKELYETVRKTWADKPVEALEVTKELLRRGMPQQAQQAERIANEGVENLQKGIDRASQLVLGDELEALKQAREQVRQLSRAVADEVAQNDPKAAPSGKGAGTTPDEKSTEPSKEPGKGQSPGQGQQPGKEPGQGQQPGKEPGQGQQPGKEPGQGQQPGKEPGQGRGQSLRSESGSPTTQPGEQSGGTSNGTGAIESPIGGRGFNEWTDRLREVEETVSDPKLRNEVARIRDAARSLRAEAKRHSKEPEWDLIRTRLIEPLTEVEKRIAEEIARQHSPDSLVPLDRDPVPDRYSELVRKYYERLGSGK